MKIILKKTILFLSVLTACSTQKPAIKPIPATSESEALFHQAANALETGQFIIKAEEFYFSQKKQSVRSPANSYISMQSDQAVIKYSPELFPGTTFLNYLNIKESAEITKEKTSRRGDIRFRMKTVGDNPSWLNREIVITLFHNTSKCFVRVGHNGDMSFAGSIYPQLTE